MDAEISRLLEFVQQRPAMYFGPLTPEAARTFLHGVFAGCHACGFYISRECLAEVAKVRGWKNSAAGIVPDMKAKLLRDEEIIHELFEVYIQAVQLTAACR